MVKNHLKRLNAPKTWGIKRKGITFVTRPKPGPHPIRRAVPLSIFIRLMGMANTSKEVKKALIAKNILVDGVRRKDPRFPVGLFDVIEVKEAGKFFRLFFKKGKVTAAPIKANDAGLKPCKIAGKTYGKGNKIQLNLSDGKNMIIDKEGYKSMDTVLIEIGKNKIKSHIKFEKGAFTYITGGKHIGGVGILDDIKGDKIIFKTKGKERIETMKKYAFVIGKEKPEINIPN